MQLLKFKRMRMERAAAQQQYLATITVPATNPASILLKVKVVAAAASKN
ncbi:hypothetical protein A2U01_0074431 [Trifolium medium]|uniref:Uncharacterized protein n=1 Tax=Trifolium medium TaxID=97028 RepID=A0A392SYP9_9FABA|nr:hypothetical protein [Trifolium medium]